MAIPECPISSICEFSVGKGCNRCGVEPSTHVPIFDDIDEGEESSIDLGKNEPEMLDDSSFGRDGVSDSRLTMLTNDSDDRIYGSGAVKSD